MCKSNQEIPNIQKAGKDLEKPLDSGFEKRHPRTKLSYCKVFHRRFISNKNEKIMNKPAFRNSILELIKILMCEFWDDYVRQKYGPEVKLILQKMLK